MTLQFGQVLVDQNPVWTDNRVIANTMENQMIKVVYPDVRISAANLQAVMYNKRIIRAMAVQIVAGQVEAHLEMINDGLDNYHTFNEVEQCLLGAKETVNDYIEDVLVDFRSAMHAELAAVSVEMSQMIINKDGSIDAEVSVATTATDDH
jgi:predicted component of viral defense system (DUF524 family)